MKVAFFGTPEIALPTLKFLHESPEVDLVLVVTQPDRPVGRGLKLKSPAVAEFAKDNGIPLAQTPNINKDPELIKQLEQWDLDFIVVFAFSHFLGKKVLGLSRLGCFNIHTSLLPRWRGAAPIQYALLNGDSETGITLFKIVKQMDAGPIAVMDKIDLPSDWTGGKLHDELMELAPRTLNKLIQLIKNDQLQLTEQDETGVTFAPLMNREIGLLDFKNAKYEQIFNQVRALDPWPGTYCFLGPKRMKVFKIMPGTKSLAPGEVDIHDGMLCVGTQDRSVRLQKIQLEGKKRTTDVQLLNGLKEKPIINP